MAPGEDRRFGGSEESRATVAIWRLIPAIVSSGGGKKNDRFFALTKEQKLGKKREKIRIKEDTACGRCGWEKSIKTRPHERVRASRVASDAARTFSEELF